MKWSESEKTRIRTRLTAASSIVGDGSARPTIERLMEKYDNIVGMPDVYKFQLEFMEELERVEASFKKTLTLKGNLKVNSKASFKVINTMFKHYQTDGTVTELEDSDAFEKMNNISNQWEDETTNKGKLYMGVFDWASFTKDNVFTIDIPNLRTGGQVLKNEKASEEFGFEIYGDCFLKSK